MAMLLATELSLYELEIDPNAFEDVLTEVNHDLFPNLNPEQIMYRPTECAVWFVKEVRRRLKSPSLPEEFIMRRLRNIQKNANTD